MKRESIAVAAAAAVGAAWLATSGGLRARAKAQLDVAAGSGDGGPVTVSLGSNPPVNTGVVPGRYRVHVPAGAHLGRHRMYRHPASCSPNTSAPQQVAYDWLYCPPSEGDL